VRVRDEAHVRDWRTVHNLVIPAASLSTAEVHERCRENRLEVAYLDQIIVGNSTV
jgi:hypothetical protein